jgi:hypothetical protein
VVAKVLRYNKLIQCRNDLGQFKQRYGAVANWKRAKRDELRAARAEFVRLLNAQLEDGDEDLRSAVRKGELDHAPRDEHEYARENELMDECYIHTGHFGLTPTP